MTEWTAEDYGPMPGPSVRREHGYRDAYARRIPKSSDKHYRAGYALGERLRPEPPDPERPPDRGLRMVRGTSGTSLRVAGDPASAPG